VAINALTDLETLEVSLVPAGANKKGHFPIKKARDVDMSDTLHAVLDAPSSSDEHFEQVIKSAELDGEGGDAIRGAMKILSAYSDVVDPAKAAALVAKAFSEKAEDEDEDEKKEEEAEKAEEEEEAPKPDEAVDEEEAVEEEATEELDEEEKRKSLTKSLDGVPSAIRKELERVWKANADLEKVLKQERDEKARKEFVAKAAEHYPNLPGITSDELGLIMKTLHDLDGQVAEKLEQVLKAANTAIASGDVFAEMGTNAEGGSGSAYGRLDSIAKELVSKSAGSQSYAKSFEQALTENPDLYNTYLNEKGA
jgi:hypothetical protein